MREILFRGKSKGKPEWVYGSLYKEGTQVFILVGGRFYPEPSNGQSALGIMDWYEVFPDSIGQFTGLTDKNSKRVFEGDIIRTDGIDGVLNWECYCDEETYDFSFCPIGHEYCSTHNGTFDEDEREVIGNIHEGEQPCTSATVE